MVPSQAPSPFCMGDLEPRAAGVWYGGTVWRGFWQARQEARFLSGSGWRMALVLYAGTPLGWGPGQAMLTGTHAPGGGAPRGRTRGQPPARSARPGRGVPTALRSARVRHACLGGRSAFPAAPRAGRGRSQRFCWVTARAWVRKFLGPGTAGQWVLKGWHWPRPALREATG